MLLPPALLEHFRNPKNVGTLAPPAITVEAENPACGDTLRLSVRWENGRVAEAAFRSRGCAASIACGSLLTVLLADRNRDELARVSAAEIDAAAGGLPTPSRHAAVLCADAVKALLASLP